MFRLFISSRVRRCNKLITIDMSIGSVHHQYIAITQHAILLKSQYCDTRSLCHSGKVDLQLTLTNGQDHIETFYHLDRILYKQYLIDRNRLMVVLL